MAGISWVKLKTDMFDNEKIKLIEALPEADTIIVIWVKLISHAGKVNSNGYIMLTENIPMNVEEISTIFGRPLNTVRLALDTFKRYGMITFEGEMIRIKNWEDHQNVDGMERVKTLNKERQQRHRDKKKLELPTPKDESNVSVTLHNGTDIDLDLDLDLEKEKDKPLKPKKVPKEKVVKPKKNNYAEFVTMTNEEHSKLISEHGEKATVEIITILDNYKGASGKKYASDYRAITNWVVKRYKEDAAKGGNGYAGIKPNSQRATNFPSDVGF
jgi:predicted phage replisome organizer